MNLDQKNKVLDEFSVENEFYRSASVTRLGKLVTHLDLFRRSSGLPGEIVECGVFKGASLYRWIKFRGLLENQGSRKIIGFDVFGEFPEAQNEADRKRRQSFVDAAGSRGPSQEEIIHSLEKQGLAGNVELISGDVLQAIPSYVSQHEELKISLLNVDVDLYEPTFCCLEMLYSKVVSGGIVILDDYGAFPGANEAIDEFFADKDVNIQKLPYSFSVSFVEKK
jgi:hypothetical protein